MGKVTKSTTQEVVVVPDDSALVSDSFAPLAKGTYEFIVDSITDTEITSGKHAGKPAFNVKLKSAESGRVLFKLVPKWVAPAEKSASTKSELDWIRMARVSFVEALGISNTALFVATQDIVGSSVKVVVDAKENGSYGVQNFVVKFQK
jgi:hypothetical protein